jgi:1-acyl-sn-glycerol-3-phosphate acyltransferase
MGFFRAFVYMFLLSLELLAYDLLQLILLPISAIYPPLVRAVNGYCVSVIVEGFVYLLEHIDRPQVIITGDPLVRNQSALVIANHQSYTDSLIISGIALRYGMLSHIKFFAKDSLKWIPILENLLFARRMGYLVDGKYSRQTQLARRRKENN